MQENKTLKELSFFSCPSLLEFTFSEDNIIVQIVIDSSRNILSMQSEKGVIQIYELSQNRQGMSSCLFNKIALPLLLEKLVRTKDLSLDLSG